MAKKRLGDRGEEIALKHLLRKGYRLVERNHSTRHGELDMILYHSSTLVFVEVKLRSGRGFGAPLEAVTPAKQATIRALAEQYIASYEPAFEEVRFDVVGVLAAGGTVEVEHVEGAF